MLDLQSGNIHYYVSYLKDIVDEECDLSVRAGILMERLKGDKMLHHFQGKIEIGTGNGGIISQLKMQNEMKLTDESWISYQQGKGNEDTIAQFFSDDESRLDLTKEQKEILEIWDGLDEKEREIFMTFIRSLKK